ALYVSLRDRVVPSEDVAKVGYLWSMGGAKERLKLVKADLLVDGSFDLAVDGVDGVFHTASPVFVPQDQNVQVNAPTPELRRCSLVVDCDLFDCWQQALIDPAIEGTKNVLKSCSKASSVRRVVLTSSCSSIRYRYDATLVSPLNESHWSDLEYCKRYNVRSLLIFLTCFQQYASWFNITDIELEPTGAMTRKVTAIHTAWTLPRSENSGFHASKLSHRCLMTASRASERRDSCEIRWPREGISVK
ncbi:hypothetical protein BHE74_00025501, partial [Ensete ventricosum]